MVRFIERIMRLASRVVNREWRISIVDQPGFESESLNASGKVACECVVGIGLQYVGQEFACLGSTAQSELCLCHEEFRCGVLASLNVVVKDEHSRQ